jgi:phosphoglycerate dehydrogenase-like enzyme
VKIALPTAMRPMLAERLPPAVAAEWFADAAGALTAVTGAEIAWLDLFSPAALADVVAAGTGLRWVTTAFAGVGQYPLGALRERGIVFTNGAGVNSIPVAEFAVMGMLAAAKNMPAIVHSQDHREWLRHAPGVAELFESRALIIGYGHIGRAIAARLRAFGADVVGVRRNPAAGEAGVLGPDMWRSRLGDFDWVVLAAALTAETRHLIGAAELQRMKPSAWIVNIARGGLIDQAALIEAARTLAIGGAFLDVTDPEPAPSEDPVWSTPNIIVTSHCSGRAQTRMHERAAELFLDNLGRYRSGRSLLNVVDLGLGY